MSEPGRALDPAGLIETLNRHQLEFVMVGGERVTVASLEDIVRSKEVSNRPKDREALPELRGLGARGVGRDRDVGRGDERDVGFEF